MGSCWSKARWICYKRWIIQGTGLNCFSTTGENYIRESVRAICRFRYGYLTISLGRVLKKQFFSVKEISVITHLVKTFSNNDSIFKAKLGWRLNNWSWVPLKLTNFETFYFNWYLFIMTVINVSQNCQSLLWGTCQIWKVWVCVKGVKTTQMFWVITMMNLWVWTQ